MKDKSLGEMIAELRKEKGMTQLELANKMGVTDKAVSKWERDLSCPDIGSFPHLAEILGVSIDELMQSKKNKDGQENSLKDTILLILRCIGLAMGVAVAVLAIMDKIDAKSGMLMLGIGLSCIALNMLSEDKE